MANKKPGPKTAAGKAAASRHSITHGITSELPVIPGIERIEDWERHHDGIIEAIGPQDAVEQALAERVAALFWRLNRLIRYEVAITSRGIESTRETYARAKAAEEAEAAEAAEAAEPSGSARCPIEGQPGYLPITITPEVVDRVLEEQTLPDYAELDKIMRFESHLHRQCVQTLHEIEALQSRRAGKPIQLTRLDISAPPAA